MPSSRLAVDGFWRCLCPSFDVTALGRPLFFVARASRHSSCSTIENRRPKLQASISTTATRSVTFGPRAAALYEHSKHIERKQGLISQASAAPSVPVPSPTEVSTESIVDAPNNPLLFETEALEEPRYNNLSEVPISQLHDVLRQIRSEEGAYRKIIDLVQHLIRDRGESCGLLYYDALIRANADAKHGSAEMVTSLLADMKEKGIIGDSGLFHGVLQALAIHPDHVLRSTVLKEMKDRWYDLSVEGWHNVVVGFLRDRQYEFALEGLQQMQEQGLKVQPWLYDICIYIFCEADELDEALRLLRFRVQSGELDISANIWHHMLDVCSGDYHYEGTLYIWQRRVLTHQLHPSDGMLTNILSLAARSHDSILATDVVRVLASRTSKLDAHHYEALLTAYAGAGELITAMRILSIMKKSQMDPTEAATGPIFTYLVENHGRPSNPRQQAKGKKQGYTPQEAFDMLYKLKDDGHPIPIAAANVVLSAALQVNSLSSAIDLYRKIHEVCPEGPSTFTFNILLAGCAKAVEENSRHAAATAASGSEQESNSAVSTTPESASTHDTVVTSMGSPKHIAMFLASEMVALSVRADALTYDRLILVCLSEADAPPGSGSTAGFEDAMLYLSELRDTMGVPVSPAAQWRRPSAIGSGNSTNGLKAAPLRVGTFSALVKRAADRGDERVWELLAETEALGLGTGRLRTVVEDMWKERAWREEEMRIEALLRGTTNGEGSREYLNPADL